MMKNMLKYIIDNIRSIFINKYIIIYTLIILCSLVNSANSNTIKKKKTVKQKTISHNIKQNINVKIQKGNASWYGKEFHGRKTASGERFDMYKVSAAHKTLPFGTILKVTNLKNNKSILVRVNDRGPVYSNRILDLSFKAAELLTAGNAKKIGVFPVKIIIFKHV